MKKKPSREKLVTVQDKNLASATAGTGYHVFGGRTEPTEPDPTEIGGGT